MKKLFFILLALTLVFPCVTDAQNRIETNPQSITINVPDTVVNSTILKRKATLFTMIYNQSAKSLSLTWTVRYYSDSLGLYGSDISDIIPDYARTSIADNDYTGDQTLSPIYIEDNNSRTTTLITLNGRVGINSNTPTAFLHLPAGTTTSNTSPFKFTSGSNLTTVENGAVEYDGTDYYMSAQGTRQSVCKGKFGSHSQVGTATTTFPVTFGGTQPNATYKVNVTPTNTLSAALFYVTNKTTTTFDVMYLAGLTGTVEFDWLLTQ